MPAEAQAVGKGVERSVDEMTGDDSTIEWRLQLRAAPVNYSTTNRCGVSGLYVVHLCTDVLIATDKIIVSVT